MMSNLHCWEATDTVYYYSQQRELQRPELSILRYLGDRLRGMNMLDIGVGGGRTTRSFASSVREYVGIDHSTNMIESCQSQLSSFPDNVSFMVCDVRDMRVFDEGSFDFILFSFNGIDYLSHEDRLEAFQQMRRVVKKGGVICFSTHNLRNLIGMPVFPGFSVNPVKMAHLASRYLRHAYRNLRFRRLGTERYAIVNDGAHGSRLATYYILPEEQLKQLSDCGFSEFRIFCLQTGCPISDLSKVGTRKDAWLYYLCER